MAQNKGRFETYDFEQFKLHVYYTGDVMGDASFIVEGGDALVTLEHPLFRENVEEFDAYVDRLGKKIEKRVADYHLGGTGDHDYAMAEGMPAFAKGPVYGGMMAHFAEVFGDAIVGLPTGAQEEVAFDTTCVWAGVPFTWLRGASSDFPGASMLIGGKVYYTHWAPARAHMSHLQLGSAAALDAEIDSARKALESGAELFVGGHGGVASAGDVAFKISYLQSLKRLREECADAATFVAAAKAAWPELPGEEGLPALAEALYR